MRKLDENKLAGLYTAGELLDNKYGEVGTESRTTFHEKSIAWYYGEILRDRRKQLKITQQELAEKVGTARSYIARVEKGRDGYSNFKFFSNSSCSWNRVYSYVFMIDQEWFGMNGAHHRGHRVTPSFNVFHHRLLRLSQIYLFLNLC